MSNVLDSADLIEYHVSAATVVDGVKALHLSKESVSSFDDWGQVVSVLNCWGYDVRDKDFISESRLGQGQHVEVEISIRLLPDSKLINGETERTAKYLENFGRLVIGSQWVKDEGLGSKHDVTISKITETQVGYNDCGGMFMKYMYIDDLLNNYTLSLVTYE